MRWSVWLPLRVNGGQGDIKESEAQREADHRGCSRKTTRRMVIDWFGRLLVRNVFIYLCIYSFHSMYCYQRWEVNKYIEYCTTVWGRIFCIFFPANNFPTTLYISTQIHTTPEIEKNVLLTFVFESKKGRNTAIHMLLMLEVESFEICCCEGKCKAVTYFRGRLF